MQIWSRTSSTDAFKNCRPGRYDSKGLTLHAAKNTTSRGLIFLREHGGFTINGVTVSACDGIEFSYAYQGFITYNDGISYPDPILFTKTCEVKPEVSQGIWISASVSSDASAGVHGFTVTVNTTSGDFPADCYIRVYNVTVPDADKAEFNHEYFLNITDLPQQVGKRGGESWYKYLESYAQSLTDIRNNCLDISMLPLLADAGSRRISENEWVLDFSAVDAYVEFMISHAKIKHLSVRSIIAVVMGDTVPYFDYDGKTKSVKYTEPLAECWAMAYYGGIYKHFSEKGRLSILQFRLQDEPHYEKCWLWAREMCRKYAPGVICGEPLDTHSVSLLLEGACDQFIPRINVYEEGADFYRRMQEKGNQVWVYSCCFPEESWFMNKFIDQPHRYSRLMSWACFSQGITGFLHWGYNYWSETGIYGTSPDARFKGDGFIVYFDSENCKILPSARFYATYEGIIEYELLSIVAKKDPQRAKAIAQAVCRTFIDFERSEEALNAAAIKLLQAAEEAQA